MSKRTWKDSYGITRARIGTTVGLADHSQALTHKAEQVYVEVTDEVTHPIRIDGAVGYDIPCRIRLTRNQARELIPLLVEALEWS